MVTKFRAGLKIRGLLCTEGLKIKQEEMRMEEKRGIGRVGYEAKGIVVVCGTNKCLTVEVRDVSPLGMGIVLPADAPDIHGKDIIIVAETVIMYANVNRQEKQPDGTYVVGIEAKKFTPDVLEYLFTHIGVKE
jgi:hypothetical protein